MLKRFEALAAELGPDAHRIAVFSNHSSLVTMVTPTWPGCLAMTREDTAIGTRSEPHLDELMTAARFELSADEIASLENV